MGEISSKSRVNDHLVMEIYLFDYFSLFWIFCTKIDGYAGYIIRRLSNLSNQFYGPQIAIKNIFRHVLRTTDESEQ